MTKATVVRQTPVGEVAVSEDADLVQRCQDGDSEAWDLLVTKYQRLVYSVPVRLGLGSEDADEVFQDVWAPDSDSHPARLVLAIACIVR